MPEVCLNVSPGCRMLQNDASSAPCALQAIALEPASAAPFVLVPERLPSEAMSAMDGKPVGQPTCHVWTQNPVCPFQKLSTTGITSLTSQCGTLVFSSLAVHPAITLANVC